MYNFRNRSAARLITLCVVLAIHAGAIFIPLGMMFYAQSHPKPIPFRVKLGGTEPSTGPEVGPPERILPTNTNGGGGTPPPPPPEADNKKQELEKQKKLLEQKKLQQKKKEQEKQKKLLEQKKKLQQKKKEQEKQKKLLEQKKLQQKKKEQERQKKLLEQKKLQQKRKEQERQRKLLEQKRLQQQVHHDSQWDNWDPTKPAGGTNFNNAVRVGTRDRAQQQGKANHGTPAGGASIQEEAYWEKFQEYFLERWQPPPGILITSATAVEIEISWDRRGRVLSKRITQSSPNSAVTQSVKMMLEKLDFVPSPPAGVATTAKFRLIPDRKY